MENRVVAIVGANGGLGTTITDSFVKTGAEVYALVRRLDGSSPASPNLHFLTADFTHPAEVERTMNQVASTHGRIDTLIHVIGGFAGGTSIADTPDSVWEQMRDLNLTTAFYSFRAAIPHLRKSRSGRLVAIGSLTAARPQPNLGAYVVFKTAMERLVQTIALENASSGMTANLVMPDTMDTPGNRKAMPAADFSKWISTQEVADVVLWLADEKAAHINGISIPVVSRHA